ncbi:MAG: hypothetical protein WB424_12375 [Terracidiphilus sp.]
MRILFISKFALLAFAALSLTPLSPAQAPIAGDWKGTLSIPGQELHLILHVNAAKDGSLTATLDSLDQAALGIPVSAITLKDSKLNLTVDVVHGSYDGTVSKDATKIEGTWTQGMPLELDFERAAPQSQAAPKPAAPSEIDGVWQGTLDAGAAKLRILFKITNTQDGLTAQMQSPDQSPIWIIASSVTRNGSALSITVNSAGITFDAKISADLASIDGSFTQGANKLPLSIKRATEQAK